MTCPRCLSDADALAVHEVWRRSLGRPLEERRDLWSAFLADYPDSPYAEQIGNEISWLDDLMAWSSRIPRGKATVLAFHRPPAELEEGLAFDVSVTVTPSEEVQRVLLHIRRDDEDDYASQLMERSGDFSWKTRVERELVSAEGMAYFVEVLDTSGAVCTRWRSASEPQHLDVREPASVPDDRWGRSTARLRTEYVDFYLSDPGIDAYWKTEADYAYRVNSWLTAVRVGVGLIVGQGGPKGAITRPKSDPLYTKPRSLSTTYAFLEFEFELHQYFAILTRGIAGSLRDAPNDEDDGDTMLGFRGAFRIGRARGTNLVAHYTIGQALGMEGGLALRLGMLERFPLGAEVIVTNFPVGGDDPGVRIIGQAGWRPLNWLEIGLRIGYDIRDINHSGASFGLDLAFDW